MIVVVLILWVGLKFLGKPVTQNSTILKLTSPNGGESWKVGSTNVISWKGPESLSGARLILNSTKQHYVGGEAQGYVPDINIVIAEDLTSSGSYNWTIPTSTPIGSYVIHIDGYDSAFKNYSFDDSDSSFNVISR